MLIVSNNKKFVINTDCVQEMSVESRDGKIVLKFCCTQCVFELGDFISEENEINFVEKILNSYENGIKVFRLRMENYDNCKSR